MTTMNSTPLAVLPMPPTLESVLCTEELGLRPARPPDHAKECRAMLSLAQAQLDSPRTILQVLADTIVDLFQVGSAGISLLTDDGERFHSVALAGKWKYCIGGSTPRNFGPCGDVVDHNGPLLFRRFERRYTYFLPLTPAAEECLLVPFDVDRKAVGTIWVIAHDERRKFDSEDLRMLVSLGTFASACYQAVQQLHALGVQAQEGQQATQTIREMNEALIVSSVRQHELAEQASLAEQKLHVSEVHYRSLFESSKDGILILDGDSGKVTDANPYITTMLGYAHDEFLGKELRDIGLFSDKSANEAAVRELKEKGYLRYEHLPLESSRGQRIEVEVVANVYGEDEHSVIQFNIRDISERRRMEKQIADQTASLSDLHQRKDEFLAMLGHELRNPLAPIVNAVHLLRLQKNENERQQQARTVIERQVTQLTRLVNDLMEVSRITTGRVQLRQNRVAVSGFVESAVETVRPLLDKHKHELTVSLPSEAIWLNADAARLEQVVVNLLTNAAKYTEEGGHIWLTVQRERDECVLRLRDTGVGIAPELLPRIFDLFTQAERSLARSQGGLGIGLALVQRLVELHNGKVEVTSVLGQGSEFVVRLPTVLTPAPLTPPTPNEVAGSTGPSLQILVVNDNLDTAHTLAMLLKMAGHEVRIAQDGPTALEAVSDFRPDVALLDIGLPGLDGFEVAKRIRQQSLFRKLVLVAITGYGKETDRQRSKEVGFDHYLIKPTQFEKVLEILGSVAAMAT